MSVGEYILLVDPDRELTETMQLILREAGYVCKTAHDGEEALSHCRQELPKMVFTEGLIPKINGLQLAKSIRELPNGGLANIVMMSAVYSGAKFRKEIEEAGIDEVLPKPFSPNDLMTKVRSMELSLVSKNQEALNLESEKFEHSGNISDTPFIRLIFHLYSKKETGTLRLQSSQAKKLVTFEEGEPKFVVSNLERECLGQLLVRQGRLTQEECERSLASMAQMKKRQGEALIHMGLIEPYELEEMLKQQAREKFLEIFAWREGKYIFVPGKVFRKELTPVDLSIAQICLRGVKEAYNLAHLQGELHPYKKEVAILNKTPAFPLEDYKLATWDMRIARQIKHGKTLEEILEMRLARDLDVYHLYFTLLMLETVSWKKTSSLHIKHEDQQARSRVETLREMSPFAILDVSPKASDVEVQRAYEEKLEHFSSRNASPEEIAELREAYRRIASNQGRRDYLIRIYEDGKRMQPEAKEVFKYEELLEIGQSFLSKKAYSQASLVFQDATAFFPEEGMGFSLLGYTTFQQEFSKQNRDEKILERAKKAMFKGIQLTPFQAEPAYFLGRAFFLEEDYKSSVHWFQKALSADSKHRGAATELRLAQMRMEKQNNTSFIKWKR